MNYMLGEKTILEVNHPSHYERNDGHAECISLINALTRDYKGVYAFCIGQIKYLYRAGSKKDEGISILEKKIQDIKKFIWYISYFLKCCVNSNESFYSEIYVNGKIKSTNYGELEILKNEFTYKISSPTEKQIVSQIIDNVYCFKSVEDIKETILLLDSLVNEIMKDN